MHRVNRHDVGVLQLGQSLRLAQNVGRNLQGHVARGQVALLGQVDAAEGAAAELCQQPEAEEIGSGQRHLSQGFGQTLGHVAAGLGRCLGAASFAEAARRRLTADPQVFGALHPYDHLGSGQVVVWIYGGRFALGSGLGVRRAYAAVVPHRPFGNVLGRLEFQLAYQELALNLGEQGVILRRQELSQLEGLAAGTGRFIGLDKIDQLCLLGSGNHGHHSLLQRSAYGLTHTALGERSFVTGHRPTEG